MKIMLLRHGITKYNIEKRYQGFSDIPLSSEGIANIISAPFNPEVVYVSPLTRARQTCKLIFPEAKQIPVEGLKEMNFGIFEGHNYIEMENWDSYREWVNGGGIGLCPNGEDYKMFSNRVCESFKKLVNDAFIHNEDFLVIVAHGGVQMAVMEYLSTTKKRDRHEWLGPYAGGYLLECNRELWDKTSQVKLLETVQFNKEAKAC